MTKYIFFILVLFIANSSNVVASKPPNIICILVDDLGYGDLSCQGATDMQTPNIDNFKKGGLTLTNFYANCTVCSPSRASLLTGRYPDNVGVPGVIRQNEDNSWGFLDPKATLIPQVLRTKGYKSAIIGKWHLGLESPNTPTERGFDYFKGFLGDMMDDYWTHRRGGINWMRENRKEIDPKGHATDLFTNWAIDYLKSSKKSEPFYLYLAYNAPHFPIQPPEEWLTRVKAREPQLSEKRAKNVAFIEHLDDAIGKVLATLKSTGLDENTLIVFTSDNGGALRYEQSNGELRGGKQDMYEGGIKVPAFVQWKNKVEAGTENAAVSMHMDLFNTFCEVAGAQINHQVDGSSLLPHLLGQEVERNDRYIYWVRREGGIYGGQAYYAARYGDYKILQNTPYEPIQFFNMKEDPLEQSPMSNEHDITYDMLRKNLQSHIQEAGKIPWQKRE
ncbi:Arylsulfatase A [Spirosomataceae bacterium TFI 002]|nr:Arylsulfatase A [Spirosomataceae bacterium TFI 002]